MKHAHANRCDFPPTRSRGTAVETSEVFGTSQVWPARARPGDYSSVDPDRPPRRRPLRLWPMSVALLVAGLDLDGVADAARRTINEQYKVSVKTPRTAWFINPLTLITWSRYKIVEEIRGRKREVIELEKAAAEKSPGIETGRASRR